MQKGDLVYLVGKMGGERWPYALGIVQNPDEWGHVRVVTLQLLDKSVLLTAMPGSTGLYRKEALQPVFSSDVRDLEPVL